MIILPSNIFVPLYITLYDKLEQKAKRDFVFPKELASFSPSGQLKVYN